jgi:hypothetical protein
MSLLARRPAILVADYPAGRSDGVHHKLPACPPTRFAGGQIRVTSVGQRPTDND